MADRETTSRSDKAGDLVNRAGALATLNRHDEALAEYDRAIGLDPEHAVAHLGRGRALVRLGRHDEAIAAYDRAISMRDNEALAHAGRADALFALGRHGEAIAAYDRAISIYTNPYSDSSHGHSHDAALAHAGRAAALRALGRHDEAVASCDDAIDSYRRAPYDSTESGSSDHALVFGLDTVQAHAHSDRTLSLIKLGKIKDAFVGYGRAIEIDFDHTQLRRALILELLELMPFDETTFRHLGSHLTNALCYKSENQLLAKFLPFFNHALEGDPDHAPVHVGRGGAICALGCHAYALAEYDLAIELDPDHAGAHHGRGRALAGLGRHDDAAKEIRRALEIDPELPGASFDEGHALLALDRHAEALAAFDRALSAKPSVCINDDGRREAGPAWEDLPQVHVSRGMALSRLGRHDEAFLAFKEAIKTKSGRDKQTLFCFPYELAPTYALFGMTQTKRYNNRDMPCMDLPIHALIGMTLTNLGRHEDALAEYTRASSSWAEIPEARRARAESLRALGRHDAVHQAHREASVTRGSEDVSPAERRARAESLRALGQHDEALVEYDSISAFRDNDPAARRAHAMTLESLGKHDKALAAYDRAIELDPGHAMAHRDRASVLLSLERPADALAALDRAAELKPDDSELHACRAHVLAALGLHPEAAEAWRRAESLGHE